MGKLDSADTKVEFIQKRMAQWERSLLIISLPHTAAFGAWLGRYDLDKSTVLNPLILFTFLTLTTVWLFLVHDQLRNTYLRGWHPVPRERKKATFMYTIFFFYPLLPFLVSIYFKDISDVEAAALVSGTLLSWYMCVMWVSADANLKIMKALGISIND